MLLRVSLLLLTLCVPIVSAAVGLPPCCCRLLCFCKHPCFWWCPYFVGGPVVAFIPDVACAPAVVSGHDIAVILNFDCCWRYCCCLCHSYFLHPDYGRHSCCCWCPLSFWWFPVSSLSARVSGVINGVVGVSAVPFEHAVAGSPAVTGFPAVEGVLAVAFSLLICCDPGVPILAGDFTYWIVGNERYYTSGQSDYSYQTVFFFWYRTMYWNIEFRIGEFKKLSDYRISDQGLNLSDFQILDFEKTISCPPLLTVNDQWTVGKRMT